MRGDHITGNYAGNLLFTVQRHIQHKVRLGHQTVLGGRILQNVAFNHAPSTERMTDHLGIVKIENRLDSSDSRIDSLGPAREAGKKMRLDETGHNLEFCFHIGFVEINFRAVTITAHTHQFCIVERIMVFDPHRIDDVPAEHAGQFLLRIRPMRPQTVDDDKILAWYMIQFFHDPGHQFMIRRRARDVGDYDRHRIVFANHAFQRRRSLRVPHCG